MTMGEKMASRQ
jgi:hypothetical protein